MPATDGSNWRMRSPFGAAGPLPSRPTDRAFQDQQTHHFTVESTTILEGLAVIAAALHHFELAARLCGVAAAWRTTYDEGSWLANADAFDESRAASVDTSAIRLGCGPTRKDSQRARTQLPA